MKTKYLGKLGKGKKKKKKLLLSRIDEGNQVLSQNLSEAAKALTTQIWKHRYICKTCEHESSVIIFLHQHLCA